MINRWLTSLLAVALMARSLAQDIPQDGPDEAPSNPCFQPVNNINIGGCSVTPAAFSELLNISRAILELLQNQQPCRTQSPTVNTPVLNPPRDCAELQENGVEGSGVYTIYPDGADGPLDVYCDMETDGGGWTVIQRRQDGSVDFYRDWDEYKHGFGNVSSEHWLGNDNIHRLSTQKTYELRFDLEDWQGETRYAVYNDFSIGDEDTKYVLNVGEYTGDAGNDVAYHNGKAFTTKDRDNDSYGTNCAVQFTGAWWYKWCVTTNLNAQYYNGGTSPYGRGMIWNSWHGNYYSLKKTEMKIRPL